MGQQKTETKTTIPGRSQQESNILQLLAEISRGSAGQLGDLGALAGGDLSALGVTAQDRQLAEQAIGSARDIAMRSMQQLGAQSQAQLGEQLASRGMLGSSTEGLQRMLAQLGLEQNAANMISQAQGQQANALMNLPFQRAQTQLGANQALFQRLTGSATPALQSMLQERLAQGSTTQTMTPSTLDYVNAGANLGSAIGSMGQLRKPQ